MIWDKISIFEPGRSPGIGNSNLFQCPCLENSMDREAWQAVVHGSWVGHDWAHTHTLKWERVSTFEGDCPVPGVSHKDKMDLRWGRVLGKPHEGDGVNATVCIYLNLTLNIKMFSMYFFTFIYPIQLIVTPTGVCFGEDLTQNTGSLLLLFSH